jgi:hypothetical protein
MTWGALGAPLLGGFELSYAAALTKTQRDELSPDQIIEAMKQGNERFLAGKTSQHDYLAQKRATVAGHTPPRSFSAASTRARLPRSFSTQALATPSMRASPGI